MKQIICLSHTQWQAWPNRTQQLLTRLRDVHILFFEPPAPEKKKSSGSPGRRVRSNITVYTLPRLRGDPTDQPHWLQRRNRSRVTAFVLNVLDKHGFCEPTLWLTSPGNYYLRECLPHRGLIYDCDREWDDLPLEWESELALHADIIFAASPGLAARLSPCCSNIALLPNGVNYVMFAREGLERPALLRSTQGPVLVHMGAIDDLTDLDPLIYAASERPDWTFLLIGSISRTPAKRLARYSNIRMTGIVPMSDVPEYLSACSVCFDLLSARNRGCDILPCHLYEYLATGKPIVTMLDHDQVEPFPDVIYTAHNHLEFLRRCERAMEEDPTWVSGRRREYAAGAQWSLRAEEIHRILETTALF